MQRQPNVALSTEEIRTRLTDVIQTRLRQQEFNATPLIDVSVLEPPQPAASS